MLPLGRNKVPGQMKQGRGPDSAHGPCVCHCDLGNSKGFRSSVPEMVQKQSTIYIFFIINHEMRVCVIR